MAMRAPLAATTSTFHDSPSVAASACGAVPASNQASGKALSSGRAMGVSSHHFSVAPSPSGVAKRAWYHVAAVGADGSAPQVTRFDPASVITCRCSPARPARVCHGPASGAPSTDGGFFDAFCAQGCSTAEALVARDDAAVLALCKRVSMKKLHQKKLMRALGSLREAAAEMAEVDRQVEEAEAELDEEMAEAEDKAAAKEQRILEEAQEAAAVAATEEEAAAILEEANAAAQ